MLNKLELIVQGQVVGFSLNEMAEMFNADYKKTIYHQRLEQCVKEIDDTIRRLQLLIQGLKHATAV
ncbi:MerR family DNA-binding protein [Raoultella planticola]|uniref:MerR family DNA-binding protein n=1 Tax=Raoultella planticola TaxID=575 RepID=UPI001CC2A29A|nr:MerR family DNA-binding protein [Raoultella planticola]MDM9676206.1 MerR family DNA-binding protein [Raoultella planticola]